jgi:septum formation protein
MLPIILASSSPYRQQLLAKLDLEFTSFSPNIDESSLANEAPKALALRLSQQKAEALANQHPNHFIIGSDQVACMNDIILNKPGNYHNAVAQLKQCSGQRVSFHTGITLLNSATGKLYSDVVSHRVFFRELCDDNIEDYVQREKPYDCAGSFKVEGLGISLFQKLEGDDPNSLIGLPLIRLIDFLSQENINVLAK